MHAGDWVTLGVAVLFVGFLAYLPYRQKHHRRKQPPQTHSNAIGDQQHDREAYIRNGGLGAPGEDSW